MPTVVEGDFEWDSEKAATNLASMVFPFQKPQPSSPILWRFISTTAQGLAIWS